MARNLGRDDFLIKELQKNEPIKKALKDAENERVTKKHGERGDK